MVLVRPIIIGHHLIFTGYGHWLPNDIRGSGSRVVVSERLRELGPIHQGRKEVQPSPELLKDFLRGAEQVLQYPVLWFGESERKTLGEAICATIRANRYTCYAGAILQNHLHLLIRRHRDDGQEICVKIAGATRDALHGASPKLGAHPIWGRDNYDIFKDTVEKMWSAVDYIAGNPAKSGLAPQSWSFVTPYDGWPHPKPPRSPGP